MTIDNLDRNFHMLRSSYNDLWEKHCTLLRDHATLTDQVATLVAVLEEVNDGGSIVCKVAQLETRIEDAELSIKTIGDVS